MAPSVRSPPRVGRRVGAANGGRQAWSDDRGRVLGIPTASGAVDEFVHGRGGAGHCEGQFLALRTWVVAKLVRAGDMMQLR